MGHTPILDVLGPVTPAKIAVIVKSPAKHLSQLAKHYNFRQIRNHYMLSRLAYLHLTLTNSKGQCLGHARFYYDYILS